MNIPKKIGCRIFQAAFHAALPVLPYREPRVLERFEDTVRPLKERKIHTVLLVSDKPIRKMGLTAPLEGALTQNGIKCVVYDDTRANPTTDNVREAKALYLSCGAQALIAFGGGSSMDCAKAVGACIAYPRKELHQLKGTLRVLRKLPLLIAIPTTAGTGSETTLTAVITDTASKHKYTMNAFPLIPRFAVLDPKVTYSLPPSLTATTGMDALTHAVEAYIGRSTSRETRAKAREAVSLIFANIERAYHNGHDHEARANMLRAAYLAGIAFSKSYVGYIHAVAHSLGGQYNTPHGFANAVLMPIVLKMYGTAADKKLHRLGVAAGVAREDDNPQDGARKFIAAIESLNASMEIPTSIAGIKESDIPEMARHADKEANPLYPVPVLMDRKELEKIYYRVADWSKK